MIATGPERQLLMRAQDHLAGVNVSAASVGCRFRVSTEVTLKKREELAVEDRHISPVDAAILAAQKHLQQCVAPGTPESPASC